MDTSSGGADPAQPKARGESRGFARNVTTLLSGTVGAQAAGAVSVPLLAFLYRPEEFGKFAIVWAIGLSVGSLSSLRYERAIVIAKSRRTAMAVTALCNRIVAVVALASASVTAAVSGLATAAGMGLLVLLFGLYQQRAQWMVRDSEFGKMARAEVLGTVVTVVVQVGAGFALEASMESLLVGGLVGRAAQLAAVWGSTALPAGFSTARLRAVAIAFRQFPAFSAPYSFVSLAISRSLVVVGAIFLSDATVGFIALAHRLTYLPITTTVNAVRRVFIGTLARGISQPGIERQTRELARAMALLAVPAAFGVGVIAPWVVESGLFVDWVGAGRFITLLMPGALAMMVTAWLDRLFEVLRRQRLAFILEASSAIVIVLVYTLLLWGGAGPHLSVAVFGALVASYNALWMCVAWRVANFDLVSLGLRLRAPLLLLVGTSSAWALLGTSILPRVGLVVIGTFAVGALATRMRPKSLEART